MRVYYHRLHFGMLACVFGLTGITLYMAFAFPYSLVHFKQADTTQLKAVIVIGRHGEVSPPREAYFEALGEEPPEDWFALGGPNQLTAIGKERLYLLGKFLRLQYYERLLASGNPRRLLVRSADSDMCLESAQALLAGLLPPSTTKSSSNRWLWSANSETGDDALVKLWQPKAIHTTREPDDDLLSSRTKCLEMDSQRAEWKNSSRYVQLLNEFRHDLQVLRQNTGLAFEDDLEMVGQLEEQLRARAAFVPFAGSSSTTMPSWYTSTLASRLAHIADVTAGARFAHACSQRLFAGRLLDTLTRNVFDKIRSDLSSGVSLLADDSAADLTPTGDDMTDNRTSTESLARSDENQQVAAASTRLMPLDERMKLKLAQQRDPAMFVYMTDKAHLSALMNSLGVYTSQPHYGAALVLELHFDPVNQIHFLRLFSINSLSHNVLPEPVRVQPLACLDSVECSPQQFKRNLAHLTLDRQAWQHACQAGGVAPQQDLPLPPRVVTTPSPSLLEVVTTSTTTTTSSPEFVVGPTDRSDPATSTSGDAGQSSTTTKATISDDTNSRIDKLDESLIVGPTHTRPISSNDTTGTPTTIASSLTEIKTTTVAPEPSPEMNASKPSDTTSESVTASEQGQTTTTPTTTTSKSPELETKSPGETMTQMTPAATTNTNSTSTGGAEFDTTKRPGV